jgi:putative ABC transport system permease protein
VETCASAKNSGVMKAAFPLWVLRFLKWFCPAHLYEEIEGDLIQKFNRNVKVIGEKRAKRRLIWNTIRFFRLEILLRNKFSNKLIQNSMLKNHFQFSLRVLSRNKAFALVSVFGLCVSVAACILVAEYAQFELSYDKFFTNHKSIYRLQHNRFVNGELLYKKAMSFPEVGVAMKEYFPEVEQVARLFPVSLNIEPVFTATLKSGEKKSFSEPNSYSADSTFCKIFDLNFIYGNASSALSGLDKVIVSRSTAFRYFGKLDVVGEILKGKDGDLTITGVFNDLAANSHLKFDMLLSWFRFYDDRQRFTWDGLYNYILLKEGSDIQRVSQRLPDFAQSYMGDYYKGQPNTYSQFELQPLDGIHLDSHLDGEMSANGNRNIVITLLIVALFMIIIAIINQVTLNTSRSLARIKEVCLRKIIGSTKTQLLIQFLIESLLLCFAATVIGLLLAWLLYPWFNTLLDSNISLTLVHQPIFWAAMAAFVAAVSAVSGFYPAFMLTRFKAYEALKGLSIGERQSHFQKVLVTSQFAISLVLIIATYTLLKQITFMQSKDLGFGIEQKLVVKVLPTYGEESDTLFNHKMVAIKNELLANSLCEASTISSSIPGRKNEWRGSTRLVGANSDAAIRANLSRVDEDFLNAFDLKLAAGGNYTSSQNNENSIIINAEAAKQLGFSSSAEAIGKKVTMMGDREIIGVVKSFHEAGLHELVSPSMFITGAGYMKFLTMSLTAGSIPDQISEVEKIWKSHFPDKPFQYFFLDEFFNRQYQADVLMGKSISLFSGIAIMIACLGLFSLSIYTIHKKTKEIGIKKILGASAAVITSELCKNFMIPLLLSALVGIPISYYLVKWWLSQYAYRIDITFVLFLIPLCVLLAIGLSTIIFQSVKAAGKNPVDSLRYEY